MTDKDRIGFDEERVLELMREYEEASKRRDRRDIETEVLSETVWKIPELRPNELIITQQRLTRLLENLTEAVEEGDEQVASMIRRKPTFWLIEEGRYG